VPKADTGEALRDWLETGKDPAEESKRILKRLKTAVSKIDAVPHLENWWRKHRADIAQLIKADADKLQAHCALRKSAILAGGEQPKSNGADPAGIDAVAPETAH
jgi:hypothetical protein